MKEFVSHHLHEQTYIAFDSFSDYLVIWLFLFFCINSVKCCLQIVKVKTFRHTGITTEYPGLPLALLHTYCWVYFIINADVFSTLLFTWWGPGFLVSAYIFLFKKDFNWVRFGTVTSWACKIIYVLIVTILLILGLPKLVFTYSLWIIADQICLMNFEHNADRARRITEDFWFFRLGYPLFLFLPFVYDFPYNIYYKILGLVVFTVWVISLFIVIKKGCFFNKPTTWKEFLRNIVYGK